MTRRLCIATTLWLAASLAGAQGTIRSIVVKGNEHVSNEAILLRLNTKAGSAYSPADLSKQKQALESMGFFEAVDILASPSSESSWDLTVQVKEWPVVKELRIVGNKAIKTADIVGAIDVRKDKIFNSNDVQMSAQKIEELYKKHGYFAQVESFGPMRESPNTISISIIELTVDSVGVEGRNHIQPWVFGKLIKTKAGDTFNRDRWIRDLSRLDATHWFKEGVSGSALQPDPGKIALTAHVAEAHSRNLGFGAQLDPRNSLAGFFKISDVNLQGTGKALSLDVMQGTSGAGGGIDLGYADPFLWRTDTSMQVALYTKPLFRFAGTGFGSNESPTNDNRYVERRVGGQVTVGKPINEQTTASVSARAENVTTSDLKTDAQTGFIQQDGGLATMTFAVTRSRRDTEDSPSRGDWLHFEFQPGYSNIQKVGGDLADRSIMGPNAYMKSSIEYRKYLSDQGPRDPADPNAPRRVLAFRMRYGMITGNVPFFEQFFAGGAESIRGYSEDRFWGKQQFLTSLEYRVPIQKGMNVITFADYGGAWGGYGSVNSFRQSNSPSFSLGYGVGIGFKIPNLGNFRLDYGFDKDGHGRAHFLLGTSF